MPSPHLAVSPLLRGDTPDRPVPRHEDWIVKMTTQRVRARRGQHLVSARSPADHPVAFGVVGSGRVGSALASALVSAGHHQVSTCGRASMTDGGAALSRVALGSDLVLVAVPDDATGAVADRLAPLLIPGQIVAHTSGAHGLGILAAVRAVGAVPLALHPAMTFTGDPGDLDRLRAGIAFGVTAPPAARAMAQRLVSACGGTIEWIAEDRRPEYHASLAHGANHLVTLVNEAADLLRDAGVTDPARMLAPLLFAALDNALRLGDAALTGPVSRADTGTVAAHLAVLDQRAPESVPSYVALARRTAARAITSGRLRVVDAEPLLDLLEIVGKSGSRT